MLGFFSIENILQKGYNKVMVTKFFLRESERDREDLQSSKSY